MKKNIIILASFIFLFSACGSQLEDSAFNEDSSIEIGSSYQELGLNEGFLDRDTYTRPYAIINNRSEGTISLIDNDTTEVMRTITAQDVGFEFEPSYVTALAPFGLVMVGDLLNNKILAFSAKRFEYIGSIDTAAGPFHMWPSPRGTELFIASIGSNKIQNIKFSMRGNRIQFETAVIDFPEFANSEVHDIVINRSFIFATLRNSSQNKDTLVRVSRNERYTRNRKTLEFSFDSHVAIARNGNILYVAESQTGQLTAISLRNYEFEVRGTLSGLSGAHGVWTNNNGYKIFVTNINSDGSDAIYEVRRELGRFNLTLVQTLDLEYSTPHNITAESTENGGNLYVTHSGSSNRHVSLLSVPRYVTRPSINGFGGSTYRPATVIGTIETGSNPFGLTLVE